MLSAWTSSHSHWWYNVEGENRTCSRPIDTPSGKVSGTIITTHLSRSCIPSTLRSQDMVCGTASSPRREMLLAVNLSTWVDVDPSPRLWKTPMNSKSVVLPWSSHRSLRNNYCSDISRRGMRYSQRKRTRAREVTEAFMRMGSSSQGHRHRCSQITINVSTINASLRNRVQTRVEPQTPSHSPIFFVRATTFDYAPICRTTMHITLHVTLENKFQN